MEIEKLDVEASMEESGGVESSNGKEALLASDLSDNLDLDEDEKENNQEEEGSKGKSFLDYD